MYRRARLLLVLVFLLMNLHVAGSPRSAIAADEFPDVPESHPYHDAIRALTALGIIHGYEDGTFGPANNVLRAQMAALIARAMGWSSEDYSTGFTDQEGVDAALWRNVGALAYYGVARGYGDGTYNPTGPVLHAQTVSFITRAMVAMDFWAYQQDDGTVYANVPQGSGHRQDLATYAFYVGGVSGRPANQPWVDWDTPGSRGWFAQVLWDALRPQRDQDEAGSPGTLNLVGTSEAAFNPTGGAVRFEIAGATLSSDPRGTTAYINQDRVPANALLLAPNAVVVQSALQPGRNDIEVYAIDTQGLVVACDVVLWAGSSTLIVNVVDQASQPVSGATITARLGDDAQVFATATSVNGQVTFSNVPDRTILISGAAGGNRFGSIATIGQTTTVQLTLLGFNAPSSIANNDISQGAAGWDAGGSPVVVLPHVEEGGGASAADTDQDLAVVTSGPGPQKVSRTFTVQPGVKNVAVRYRFSTTEVPGGYFGSRYNDYFSVSLRSQAGGSASADSQSMNGLGRSTFDASGKTAWMETTLAVNEAGDTIQFDGIVSNVADGAYDSALIVDKIEEKRLAITAVALKDTYEAAGSYKKGQVVNLEYLSISPHTWYQGNTRIHGTITVEGAKEDALDSLVLEVVDGGSVVATAQLADVAQEKLITEFGDAEKLTITTVMRLFDLPSDQLSGIEDTKDGTLTLRVKATSHKGQEATTPAGTVKKLARFTGTNRFSGRDPEVGGDSWVIPSVRTLIDHYSQFTWNDFSNMNGGPFPIHQAHQRGISIDGRIAGSYTETKDPKTGKVTSCVVHAGMATGLIAALDDTTYSSRIKEIYVTYDSDDPNDEFWNALKDKKLKDGTAASAKFKSVDGHCNHFHWEVEPAP